MTNKLKNKCQQEPIKYGLLVSRTRSRRFLKVFYAYWLTRYLHVLVTVIKPLVKPMFVGFKLSA